MAIDLSERAQPLGQRREVGARGDERADLDGIAAAESRRLGRLDGEEVEAALHAAGAAALLGTVRERHATEPAFPDVRVDDLGLGRSLACREPSEGAPHLHRGGEVCRGAEDAGGVAGGRAPRLGDLRHEAAQARGVAGNEERGEAGRPDAGAVDPGGALLDAGVVQKETRLEAVEPVDDEVDSVEQLADVARAHVDDDGLHGDVRVDAGEASRRRDGLREALADVRLLEERLPLEVRELDDVAVDDPQESDARPGEEARRLGPQAAAAGDEDPGRPDPGLAGLADGAEEDLAGVAIFVGTRHRMGLRRGTAAEGRGGRSLDSRFSRRLWTPLGAEC